jgi:FtsP/CotA-like multicopper oxidase with cupredoxin domain
MLTRRDLMKLGLVGTGLTLLPHNHPFGPVRSSFADDYDDAPSSPATTPWLTRLPVPPLAQEVPRFYDVLDYPAPPDYAPYIGAETAFYRIVAEPRSARFHPALPETLIWGYRDDTVPAGQWPCALGPTLAGLHGFNALGGGMVVRHANGLPANHRGFGVPFTTVHFHGGHHLSRSDGFPTDLHIDDTNTLRFVSAPGEYFDHCYPVLDPGFLDFGEGWSSERPDVTERPSTLWYHDHLLDFTAPNVYRGLVGFSLMFDELDSGDETDTNPAALRLPGFPEYDIPLLIQDKRFNRDGSLWFSTFDHDGFLGDKFLVNGAIQPYFEVQKRKYRFRILNGSNARIYQLYLTNALGQTFPMTQIATEGGLLSKPIPRLQNFMIAPAERVEVVVDFGAVEFAGQQEIFLENRLQQTDGRKPDGTTSRGTRLLKFTLVGDTVDDPSQVGRYENGELVLRRFDPIRPELLELAVRRTFEFDRSSGAWTVNGRLAGDLDRSRANPVRGRPEIWRLVNKSGGWWHPIHVHSEFMRVIRQNGQLPPLAERDGMAKKDTILLRDNSSVEVFVQFRDYTGPFVFHCHNLEHEDMAMMARFDVV